ncbi:MAG: hypothetical protein QOH48_1993 [Actinomycetota bacterium]|nr:hypothetical protein [Actinomycetota bacterium]
MLDNILNEIPGFFSAGELRFLLERLRQHRFCGCGKSFSQCEVWSKVLTELLGAGQELALEQAISRQKAISGTWRTWQLLHQVSRRNVPAGVHDHVRLMSQLYKATGTVTGARVIVDSSKRPWDAVILGLIEDVSPFFVHLVRDPRAMAYSQSKVKANPDRNQPAVMAPTAASRSALQWIRRNLAADAVRKAQPEGRSLLVNYHTFCSQPIEVVRAITELVREGEARLPFVDDHTVSLGGNHTVSGNPDRFRTGLVAVREDNKWIEEMSPRDRIVVTALTQAFRARYTGASWASA